jgi:hypothetical protein
MGTLDLRSVVTKQDLEDKAETEFRPSLSFENQMKSETKSVAGLQLG